MVGVVLALCLLSPANASAAAYGVRLPSDGLVVEVPYTAGTHREHVTEVDGVLHVDPQALRLERGARLSIPVASFRGDNAERECHLREALGLDYSRSRFPREHVCDKQNRLPASGPDAIAYPDIVLALDRAAPASAGHGAGAIVVDGTLTAHGVSRPIRFDLTVSRGGPEGTLRVRGRVPVRLSDFGVVVKSANVLFVTISVGDVVTVDVDAVLEPLTRGAKP